MTLCYIATTSKKTKTILAELKLNNENLHTHIYFVFTAIFQVNLS